MAALTQEIARRKTFAIISHPDAGKTTLTEKFLLFGGAIQTAGAVKSNKITKTAASDFMEIERQQGISVATSVMAFEYQDCLVNLLDTPGHRDFAEDTYRTLTAVDSVILVIDCVKGVEAQTERLMEVCRMRDTPVIIFINKMDLEGRDGFDLLDELEEKLSIKVRRFRGRSARATPSRASTTCLTARSAVPERQAARDRGPAEHLRPRRPLHRRARGRGPRAQLREDVEMVEGVYDPLDMDAYARGEVAPVFFGSAVNNFGVRKCWTPSSALPHASATVHLPARCRAD